MTPQFWQKVVEARQQFLALPPESQPDFLAQLRTREPEVATQLETLLAQQPTPDPETVDHIQQAECDRERTLDYMPTDSLTLPSHIGRYAIDQKLGEGGMGVVYRGWDPDLHRFLAVKVVKEGQQENTDLCRRFLEEAQIMGQLQHPGIAPIHEIGSLDDGRPFFSMKQIQGKTLANLLKERSSPSADLPRFVSVFGQVCQTLAFAHARGIIHRDLKPANIMVGAFGEVQIMDWGLAKLTGTDETKTGVRAMELETLRKESPHEGTEHGVALGTPAYMAPEQARGEIDDLDPRADVFGLGAILCQILTGQPAYRGANAGEILRQAAEGNLTEALAALSICRADFELITLAKNCLAPRKEDRLLNAEAVANAVSSYQESVQEKLRQTEVQRAAAQAKAAEERKRRWLSLGLAAAILLLIAGASAAVIWYQHHQIWLSNEQTRLANEQADQDKKELQRQANEARLVADAEHGIRKALDQAQLLHEKLAHRLRQPRGVFTLLNEPGNWQARNQQALEVVRTAKALHKGIKGKADPKLARRIQIWEDKLEQAEADRNLALQLHEIRLNKLTLILGQPRHGKVVGEYADAFQKAGLDFDLDSDQVLVNKIQQSAIQEQLVASLDDWAMGTWFLQRDAQNAGDQRQGARLAEMRKRLLRLAKQADSDLWRGRVRDPAIWGNRSALEQLAEQAPVEKLSPQLASVFVELLIWNKAPVDAWLRKVQSQYPSDFLFNLEMGNRAILPERLTEWTGVRASIKANPDDPLLQLKMAKALGFYRAALAVRPKSSVVYSNIGITLSFLNDLDGAADAFQTALQFRPDNAIALTNLGTCLHEQNKRDEAIIKLRQAIALDPNLSPAYNHLGLALQDRKDLPEAIKNYRKAIALVPRYAKYHYNLGHALLETKDFDGAIMALKEAVALDSTMATAYSNLGAAYHGKGNWSKAIDAYQKAIARDPKLVEAHYNLGTVLLEQGQLDKAMDVLKNAAKINSKSTLIQTNIGSILFMRKELDAAADMFRKAIKIDPKYPLSHYNLGLVLIEQKDLDGAVAEFTKAVELDANDPRFHGVLASTLHQQGHFAKAIQANQDGLKNIPPNHPARRMIQQQLNIAQHFANLKKKLPSVLQDKLKVKATDLRDMADMCRRYLKRHADAVLLYRKAFTADPRLAMNRRFSAARSAALSLSMTSKEKEQQDFRKQALEWLQADLDMWAKLLEKKNPLAAIVMTKSLSQWQKDESLSALRDADKLKSLTKEEQQTWQKLWDNVKETVKQSRSQFKETSHQERLTPQKQERAYPIKLLAGKTYIVNLDSTEFDPLLRLESTDGKILAKDDDSGGNFNARLILTPPKDGAYKLVASSFQPKQSGTYTLWIREFAGTWRPPAVVANPRLNAAVLKAFQGKLAKTDPLDTFLLTMKNHRKVHEVEFLAGKTYQIDLTGTFDTFLRIEDAGKKPVLYNDDVLLPKNFNSRLIFQPAKKATYRLIVTSFKPATGAYSLKIREAELADKAFIFKDKLTKTDKIARGKHFKLHKIKLIGGRPHTIEVASPQFDTVLVLLDATGKRSLVQNDDIAPGKTRLSRIDVTPEKTGTFLLVVTTYGKGETGAYAVRVQSFRSAKNSK